MSCKIIVGLRHGHQGLRNESTKTSSTPTTSKVRKDEWKRYHLNWASGLVWNEWLPSRTFYLFVRLSNTLVGSSDPQILRSQLEISPISLSPTNHWETKQSSTQGLWCNMPKWFQNMKQRSQDTWIVFQLEKNIYNSSCVDISMSWLISSISLFSGLWNQCVYNMYLPIRRH